MEHNLTCYHDQLLTENFYAAAHTFSASFTWHLQRNGDVLINRKTKQNAVVSVVAHVLESRLDCTAVGNLGNRSAENLLTVKYQLLLCQGLAGPWYAQCERGTVGARVSGSMVRELR